LSSAIPSLPVSKPESEGGELPESEGGELTESEGGEFDYPSDFSVPSSEVSSETSSTPTIRPRTEADELNAEGTCLAWEAEMIKQARAAHEDPEELEAREEQYREDFNEYQRKWDERWLVQNASTLSP